MPFDTPTALARETSRSAAELTAARRWVDGVDFPACHLAMGGELLHLNAVWRHMAGLSVIRKDVSIAQLLDVQDRVSAMSRLKETAEATEPSRHPEIVVRLTQANGPPRWYRLQLQAVDRTDRTAGWLCMAFDVHAMKLREAELEGMTRMQTGMLDQGLDCMKLLSPTGHLIYANRAGCIALGIPSSSQFGMPWLELLPTEIRPSGEVALEIARSGQPARFPGRSVLPGEAPRYWDNMLTPVLGADGTVTSIWCVSREVTQERAAQEALKISEERLSMAATVGGLGIWDYNFAQDLMHCDESWYRIMGRDSAKPIRSLNEFKPLIHPDDVARATDVDGTAAQVMASGGNYEIEFRIVRPDGEVRWVRSIACLRHGDEGIASRAVGFVVDITQARRQAHALLDSRRVLEEEKLVLERQSLEDPLTGLSNRRALDRELERAYVAAGRQRRKVALVMLDVDHFKRYNDHYGHVAGDHALRQVAAALRSVARREDFVARYGGEEFVMVPALSDGIEAALQRVRSAVEALDIVHAESPFGRVTVSIGCVILAGEELGSPASLLSRCDAVLYRAKAAGRNRYLIEG